MFLNLYFLVFRARTWFPDVLDCDTLSKAELKLEFASAWSGRFVQPQSREQIKRIMMSIIMTGCRNISEKCFLEHLHFFPQILSTNLRSCHSTNFISLTVTWALQRPTRLDVINRNAWASVWAHWRTPWRVSNTLDTTTCRFFIDALLTERGIGVRLQVSAL